MSAEVKLLPDEARVENLNARAADAHWTGFVGLPRGCGVAGACLVHFNLNTDQVSLDALQGWLGPRSNQRRWYQMLSTAPPGSGLFLENLRAAGKMSAGHFSIHNLVADRVSALLELDRGKMKVSDLRADLLGGKHSGEWAADFSAATPVYTGSGTLAGISLGQMAGAMEDPWISGTGAGSYQFKASGTDSLASHEPELQIVQWQGRAHLHDGKIEIEKGSLISSGGAYEISGTASLGKELDFKLSSDTQVRTPGAGSLVYHITGTLTESHVVLTPTPETQAQLKP
jgi:hypothetical protein